LFCLMGLPGWICARTSLFFFLLCRSPMTFCFFPFSSPGASSLGWTGGPASAFLLTLRPDSLAALLSTRDSTSATNSAHLCGWGGYPLSSFPFPFYLDLPLSEQSRGMVLSSTTAFLSFLEELAIGPPPQFFFFPKTRFFFPSF